MFGFLGVKRLKDYWLQIIVVLRFGGRGGR